MSAYSFLPPVVTLSQRADGEISDSGMSRRLFIKRTGGATVATIVAWNLATNEARAQTYSSVSGSGCDADREWIGSAAVVLPFQNLIPGMKADLANTQEAIKNLLASTFADSGWPSEWGPFGELNQFFSNTFWPALVARCDQDLAGWVTEKTGGFTGKAKQKGTTLGSPKIIGPGSLVNLSTTFGLSIGGVGLAGAASVKLQVKDMIDLVMKCRFDTVDTGPETKDVDCEGGQAVVEDTAEYEAIFTTTLTLGALKIKYSLDNSDTKDISITVSSEEEE